MARRRKTTRRRNPIKWGTFAAGAVTMLTVTAAGFGIWKLVKKPKTPSLGPGNGATA